MGLTSSCACFETNTWARRTLLLLRFSFFYVEIHTYIEGSLPQHAHTSSSSAHTADWTRAGTCMEIFYHLIPPIAVQCAGPSWQPLWGSPTLPWPTCTLTEGSGAGLCTMLRLAAPPPKKMLENRVMERRSGPAARPLDMWNIQISPPHCDTATKKEGGGGWRKRAVMQKV